MDLNLTDERGAGITIDINHRLGDDFPRQSPRFMEIDACCIPKLHACIQSILILHSDPWVKASYQFDSVPQYSVLIVYSHCGM